MEKIIKLKQLKAALDKLTPEELNVPLAYNCNDMGLSGIITKIRKAKADLIYDGSDDPSFLRTRAELKEDCGYDKDEIASMDVAIPKGSLYLEF